MTIINGSALLRAAPLSPMLATKERAHGVSHGLSEAGYDLRIRQTIRFVPPDPLAFQRVVSGAMSSLLGGVSIRSMGDGQRLSALEAFFGYVEVEDWLEDEGHVITRTPGRFTLASSIESFNMPTNLLGIVHDKSTWIRQGMSVANTVIEPGWGPAPDRPEDGCFLTLELTFHGNEPLTIRAGSGIAQVIFHEIGEPARYGGKYTGQPSRPVAAILEKG